MDQLTQLKQYTTVVADTGDFASLHLYAPQDATTNPSLILKAAQQDQYQPLLAKIVQQHHDDPIDIIIDHLLVAFGLEILRIIPGRVSTEVDARLSFDIPATVAKARELIAFYAAAGIARERVLIKIAATWEGIRAAEILENQGIHCNLTLLFSLTQAVACANAQVTLISPFVGRITDWYKKTTGLDYPAHQDPGVQSVQTIYAYFKKFDCATAIMGASFRNTAQIIELAGCDLLTISPQLLAELQNNDTRFVRKLSPQWASDQTLKPLLLDEATFRWHLNQNAMATEKLAEGIRVFAADAVKLEQFVARVMTTRPHA